MYIITLQSMIANVAECWKRQYYVDDKWRKIAFGNAEEIYNKLANLDGLTATPEDVKAIISDVYWNWIFKRCSECNNYVPNVIMLGEEPDYDSSTVYICFDCFKKAVELLKLAHPSDFK